MRVQEVLARGGAARVAAPAPAVPIAPEQPQLLGLREELLVLHRLEEVHVARVAVLHEEPGAPELLLPVLVVGVDLLGGHGHDAALDARLPAGRHGMERRADEAAHDGGGGHGVRR